MKLVSGQSAIEYLMTYGWMLLVVAIAGAAVFGLVQGQAIESTSGFIGGDIGVDDFGLSNSGSLDMVIRNKASDTIELREVTLSRGDEEFTTGWNEDIRVGDSMALSSLGVDDSNSANKINVKIIYDSGGLTNQVITGSVSGRLDMVMSGETDTPDWAYVDLSEVSSNIVDTRDMDDFYMMKYEASRSDATSSSEGTSGLASSNYGRVPWTSVDQATARQACRSNGYNLTTSSQWQASTMAEIGNPLSWPEGNNGEEGDAIDGIVDPTNNERVLTGTGPESWSNELGIHDLNGNVWEMTNTTFNQTSSEFYDVSSKNVGGGGYINSWNPGGPAPESLVSPEGGFGWDYYNSDASMSDGEQKAVIFGGNWDDMSDAGVFTTLVSEPPTISGPTIGFRCSISQ